MSLFSLAHPFFEMDPDFPHYSWWFVDLICSATLKAFSSVLVGPQNLPLHGQMIDKYGEREIWKTRFT